MRTLPYWLHLLCSPPASSCPRQFQRQQIPERRNPEVADAWGSARHPSGSGRWAGSAGPATNCAIGQPDRAVRDRIGGARPQAIQTLDELGQALTDRRSPPTGSASRATPILSAIARQQGTVGSARGSRRGRLPGRQFHVDRGRMQPVGMGVDGLLVPTPDQTRSRVTVVCRW